jgi:hypothetical protein
MANNGPKDLPPATSPEFLAAVRERVQTLLGFRGNALDAALTPRAMGWKSVQTTGGTSSGSVVRLPDGGIPGGGTSGTGADDLTPPPSVTGLSVAAGVTNVFVQIDAPLYTWGGGNKQTNVYGVSLEASDTSEPTFGDAQLVYSMAGPLTFAAIPSEPNRRWHLWVKFETYAGVVSASPTGGLHGQTATTGDASNLIQSLQAATAWIDSAMVANLSAAHLTAGDGVVGGTLKSTNYVPGTSGWLLNPTLGRLYAMDAVLSGTIYATYGSIGSISIFSNSIESGNYDGASTGFALDGATGAIHAYSGTFGGALSGATGTFAGALSAATGTFSGALSAATGTFSGELSAATGTFSGSLTASAVNAVDTINIRGDAVVVPAAKENTSTLTLTNDGYTPATLSLLRINDLNCGGYPVFISVSFDGSTYFLPNDTEYLLTLKVNGVVEKTKALYEGGAYFNVVFQTLAVPAAGLVDIELFLTATGSSTGAGATMTIGIGGVSIFALGCKNNI